LRSVKGLYVAVCCSVLQCFWLGAASVVYEGLCVVACCSELQCAVVSCSVLQYPACVAAAFAFCEKLCVAVRCRVLQFAGVSSSILHVLQQHLRSVNGCCSIYICTTYMNL